MHLSFSNPKQFKYYLAEIDVPLIQGFSMQNVEEPTSQENEQSTSQENEQSTSQEKVVAYKFKC